MQMWNVEIKNLNNKYLLKGKKESSISLKIFTILKYFCIIPAVLMLIFGLIGIVDAEIALPVFLFESAIGALFWGFARYNNKLLKECEAEIEKRLSSGKLTKKDYEEAFRPKTKQEKKTAIQKYAFIAVSFIIILFICISCSDLFKSPSPSSYEEGAGGHRKGTQAEYEYKRQNGLL